MPSASSRVLTVVVATASLLVAGLIGPAAGEPAPVIPATVARTMHGLPAAHPGARLSRPVETAIPFSMVGFEVPDGASLEFRTSADGETWGAWTPAEVVDDEGPDPTSAEGRAAAENMTVPIWVGEASAVQTRLEGGGDSAVPDNVAVHLVDSSGLGRSWGTRVADRVRAAWRGTPSAASAAVGAPAIVSRAQWGANESLRRSGPSYASGIKAGFLHHTVNSNSYSREQAPALVRGIYSYHVQSQGWSDIGYNFLVDRFGTIYEGRYGGINKPVIGAHAGGFNTGTFGVSLIGTFTSVAPPADMRAGLRQLLAWKYDLHHTSVLGETSYTTYGSTRYPSGGTVRIKRLSGHREASTTSCPGDKAYALLPDMRKSVAELQGPVILDPIVYPTTVDVVGGRSVSGPVTFGARLRPAGDWKVTLTAPDGHVRTLGSASSDRVSVSWTPDNVALGTYRYSIASPGRRPARGLLTFKSPTIEGSASPSRTTFASDGTLAPVTFTGTLYANANWRMRVFDPAGVRVKRFRGQGASFTRLWEKPVSLPGRYTWDLSADGGTPVTGAVQVEADFVDRLAPQSGTAAAAAEISRQTFVADSSALQAVLTPLGQPGHALAAGPLAGTTGPVLYTGASTMPAATLAELERVLPAGARVYVMGDTISNAALARIDARRRGRWVVHRIAGSSSTAVAAAAAPLVLGRTTTREAVVVGNSGSGAWRQSVAAGAYATKDGLPILLTGRARLSRATAQVLSRPNIRTVTVVGNSDSVAPEVVRTIRQSKKVTRVGGRTSAHTAVAVARQLFGRSTATASESWLFAGGGHDAGWTRALAAAPLAARRGAPLLIARRDGVPSATAAYLDGLGYGPQALAAGSVLGGEQHIGAAARTTLARLLQ